MSYADTAYDVHQQIKLMTFNRTILALMTSNKDLSKYANYVLYASDTCVVYDIGKMSDTTWQLFQLDTKGIDRCPDPRTRNIG